MIVMFGRCARLLASIDSGGVRIRDLLGAVPAIAPITWLVQIMLLPAEGRCLRDAAGALRADVIGRARQRHRYSGHHCRGTDPRCGIVLVLLAKNGLVDIAGWAYWDAFWRRRRRPAMR